MDELVNVRCEAAKCFDEVVAGCEWLKAQKVLPGNVHSYWTYVACLDTNKVGWHEFRDKFRELGGDGVYAAWKLAYQEPLFKEKAFLGRENLGIYDDYDYTKVSCPNAEYLQERVLQFKTNYFDIEEAKKQAEILKKTIAFFA